MRNLRLAALCAGISFAFPCGCAPGEWQPEAVVEVPVAEIFPADGAMALPESLELLVGAADEVPEVRLRAGEGSELLDCEPLAHHALRCPAPEALAAEDLRVSLEGEGWAVEARMTRRLPESGEAWISEQGLELVSVGGTSRAAGLLQGLTERRMVLVRSRDLGGWALRMGPGWEDERGLHPGNHGLSLVLPLPDRTSLDSEPVNLWLSTAWLGGEMPLPLLDVVTQGESDARGLTLELEGVVRGADLLALGESWGVPAAALRAALDLDLDLDGDGDPDAATVRMALEARPGALHSW